MEKVTLVLSVEKVLENFVEEYPDATPKQALCYGILWNLEASHTYAQLPFEQQQQHYDRIYDEIEPYFKQLAKKKVS